jgi:hypothetical protein
VRYFEMKQIPSATMAQFCFTFYVESSFNMTDNVSSPYKTTGKGMKRIIAQATARTVQSQME